MRKLSRIVFIALALVLMRPSVAGAGVGDEQPGAGGSQAPGRLNAWAYWIGVTGGGSEGGANPIPCNLKDFYIPSASQPPEPPAEGQPADESVFEGHVVWAQAEGNFQDGDRRAENVPPGTPGASWERRCVSNKKPDFYGWMMQGDWIVWVLPGDPASWGEFSFGTLGIKAPQVETSPTNEAGTLVNFDTWAWVDGGVVTRQELPLTAGPVLVELWAQPQSITVDWGDGASSPCPGGGAANQPVCHHQYQRASESYTITITVVWEGGFNVYYGGGFVGSRAFNPQPYVGQTSIRVAEGQAVVTENR